MMNKWLRSAVLASAAMVVTSAAAQGTDYPARPVKIVVPLAAGGGVDVIARLMAERLAFSLKQPFVVENRAGGSGTIGTEYVARSPGDGYTLLFTGNNHTLNPSLFKLRFDAHKDFMPISHTVNTYQILLAHPSTGISTVADLIRVAKASPGKLAYGSAGSGTPGHVAGVVFEKMAGVSLTHVPYKGAGPATNDLLGGQIQLLFSSLPSALPQVAAGRVKALGISSAERSALAPALPTIAEAGLPGYRQITWFGLLAPTGTSEAIRRKLSEEIAEILKQPEVKQILQRNGMEAVGSTPVKFGEVLDAEFIAWPAFVKDTPIQVD